MSDETAQAADNLKTALERFQKSRVKDKLKIQETPEFYNLNNAIRYGLKALGENPMEVDTLTDRGLFNTPMDEAIPDTYVPGVEKLIRDLEKA